jgi:hypothetical protein
VAAGEVATAMLETWAPTEANGDAQA